MEAVETQPASSPAIEMPKAGTEEYAEWRITGELPKPKTAAPATAEKEGEPGDPPAPPKQEQRTERKRDRNAEARIKELTDKVRELESRTKKEPDKPQAQQPQTYPEWRKAFNATKWVEQYGKENPNATYEEATAAMADHLGDVRDQFKAHEARQQATAKEVQDKVDAARARYGAEKLDEVMFPTNQAIVEDQAISPSVKAMINDSDVLPDLLFVLGSDQKELAVFMQMAKTNPGKALRYIAAIERHIEDKLAVPRETPEPGEDGKFKPASEQAPVKRGPESAPPPPFEIGGRGPASKTEAERATAAIAAGTPGSFRAWKQAKDAEERRRRGA